MYLWGPLRGLHWGVLACLGFFETSILYAFGRIPKNAYSILASPFKEECRMPTYLLGVKSQGVILVNSCKLKSEMV